MAQQLAGSIFCIFAFISRFDDVTDFFKNNFFFAIALCSVYEFAFAVCCVATGSLAVVRLLCVIDSNLIEVKFGQFWVRTTDITCVILVSMTACGILIVTGDIATGAAFNLITNQSVPLGM